MFHFVKIIFHGIILICLSCCEKQAPVRDDSWQGDEDAFKDRFDLQDQLDATALLFDKKNNELFTGKVEKLNQKKSIEQSYESGLLQGTSTIRSSDGSWVTANYSDGKLHGEMILYDSKGRERSKMQYHLGKLVPKAK